MSQQVSFVAAGALANNATTTTLPIVAPSFTIEGERGGYILIAAIHAADNQVITAPTGWTKFVEQNNGVNQRVTLAWKRADADDGDATFNFTKPTDNNLLFCGVISVWRGCVRSGSPIDATTPSFDPAAAAQDAIDYADFNPTLPCHVVAVGFYANDLTTAGSISGTNPTFQNRWDLETATGGDGSIMGYSGDSDGAATGTRSHSTTSTTDAINVGILFGLLPEPDHTTPIAAPAPRYGRLLGAINRFLFLAQAAAGGGSLFTQTTGDTLSLTESLTRQAQKALGDAVGLTESLSRQSARAILETVVLTEALPRQINRPLAETLSLAEDLQAVKLVAMDIPETLSLTEQLDLAVQKSSDLAETLSLTEQLARQTGRSLAETVSLAENLTAIKAIFKELAETVTLTENLARVIQKASGLAEAVDLAEQLAKQTNRTVAETVSLTENLVAIKVAQAEVADVLALSETVTRLTARVLEETVGLTEAQQREVRKVLAETVGFAEQLVATIIREAAVSDTVVLTETLERQIGKAVQETLGLTETRLVQLARRITETVDLQEVLDVLFVPSTPAVALIGFRAGSVFTRFIAPPDTVVTLPSRPTRFISPERPRT